MRQVLAILTLSIYLLATTELHQVLRIPILIEHFSEHRQWNASIDFYAFLKMHYFQNEDNDNDKDRDAQLPFKSAHFDEIVVSTAVLPTPPVEPPVDPPNTAVQKAEYQHQHFTSDFQFSIWQPPRA